MVVCCYITLLTKDLFLFVYCLLFIAKNRRQAVPIKRRSQSALQVPLSTPNKFSKVTALTPPSLSEIYPSGYSSKHTPPSPSDTLDILVSKIESVLELFESKSNREFRRLA